MTEEIATHAANTIVQIAEVCTAADRPISEGEIIGVLAAAVFPELKAKAGYLARDLNSAEPKLTVDLIAADLLR